jgi:hypothetical protein
MAIQQVANVNIILNGDGTSTSFTYSFESFYETVNGDSGQITNPGTVPTSATLINTVGNIPAGGAASLDGFGNIVLTFPSAWTGLGTCYIQLNFNSGTLAGTTQAWTSATALNTAWTLPLNGSNAVMVGFVVSGTLTGGTIVFEVSQDGANWFPVQGSITSGYTALTGWTPGVGSLPISIDVAGFAYFRNRISSVLTGTGTVTFIIQGDNSTNEPVPTVGQANGTNLHMTLDDAAGGNAVNTVVKGTQGARAITTQDIKDSGRTYVTFSATAAAGVTTEALFSFSQNKGGTVTAGVSSYTITSGKTFRIQSISVSVRAGAAAVPFSRCILRSNTAGATVATSNVVYNCGEVFGIAATIGVGGNETIEFPDGLEIAGNGTVSFGMSHLDQATTNIVNVTIAGFEY